MQLTLKDFPLQAYDKLRFADTDSQGHVNSAVFSTFLESGRAEMLYDAQSPLVDEGAVYVVAKLDIQLLGEVLWPGKVDIGTAVLKVGNSSVNLFQQLYQNGKCVAKADTVIVQMNEVTRKSQPLSTEIIETLNRFLLPQE